MVIPVETTFACQRLIWKYVDGFAMLGWRCDSRTRKCRSELQKALPIIAMSVSTSQLYLITSYEKPKKA